MGGCCSQNQVVNNNYSANKSQIKPNNHFQEKKLDVKKFILDNIYNIDKLEEKFPEEYKKILNYEYKHFLSDPDKKYLLLIYPSSRKFLLDSKENQILCNTHEGQDLLFSNIDNENIKLLLADDYGCKLIFGSKYADNLCTTDFSKKWALHHNDKSRDILANNNIIGTLLESPEGRQKLYDRGIYKYFDNNFKFYFCSKNSNEKLLDKNLIEYIIDIFVTNREYNFWIDYKDNFISTVNKKSKNEFMIIGNIDVIYDEDPIYNRNKYSIDHGGYNYSNMIKYTPRQFRADQIYYNLKCEGNQNKYYLTPGHNSRFYENNKIVNTFDTYFFEKDIIQTHAQICHILFGLMKKVKDVELIDFFCEEVIKYEIFYEFLEHFNVQIMLEKESSCEYLLKKQRYNDLLKSEYGRNILLTVDCGRDLLLKYNHLDVLVKSKEGRNLMMINKFQQEVEDHMRKAIVEYDIGFTVMCPYCRQENDKYKKLTNKEECNICIENKTNIKFTKCRHYMCLACVMKMKPPPITQKQYSKKDLAKKI
jgi:hypothetical protein